MKTNYNIFRELRKILCIGAVSMMAFSCAQRPVTRADVQADIEEANVATQEAHEKTQQAIETREQYAKDKRQEQVRAIEERIEEIDRRISSLRDVSSDSQNMAAVENVEAAILNLQSDRNALAERMNQVRAIEDPDWSTSYDNIDMAVQQIEQELEELQKSIEPERTIEP